MSADNSPAAVEKRSRLHATLEDLVREHGGSAVLWQLTVILGDVAEAAVAAVAVDTCTRCGKASHETTDEGWCCDCHTTDEVDDVLRAKALDVAMGHLDVDDMLDEIAANLGRDLTLDETMRLSDARREARQQVRAMRAQGAP